VSAGMEARHSSETNEHYTPLDVIERAREALWAIELDPASCALANESVRAVQFFDQATDGLSRPWHGTVFLNPPGGRTADGRSSQKIWWQKLVGEYGSQRTTAAVFVSFSIELLQTSPVKSCGRIPQHFPICFPSGRLAYRSVGDAGQIVVGRSPPHASMIVYLGPHVDRFRGAFADLGHVMVPS
jgi:ParB family chromosome partitioning protein